MSWPIRKSKVEVRVTRFLPEVAPAPAGLSDEERQAHRAKRAKECEKVEPATELYELRTDALRFMYGAFVPLIDVANTPHPSDCQCVTCVPRPEVKRQPYDSLYLKQKADPWR